ncbi:MAG: hypothetical protein ACKOW9_05425, partial [Candidatus Paceibacterota bacterium]
QSTKAATFVGIQGSGSWQQANSSFEGTTTNYPNGTYNGNITTGIPSGDPLTPPTILVIGTWNGQVTNGLIAGTITWTDTSNQNPWINNTQGTWLGTTAYNPVNFDPSIDAGTGIPGTYQSKPKDGLNIGCNITTIFTNCLVAGLYYIVFEPLSFLTTLAATFLDFFIYYSVSSESYTSGFVEKAWSVVRDIANMFFILALLYVGIKTILGMNTSSNKRILGMIVLIALIMNFSLFVSRVVIDASNILARVFYTNITPYNANGQVQQGDNEAKSISVGLVRTFSPQKVVSNPADDIGNFAIVTIIFIIFLLYMIFMFVSVALLFVARVAGLWIVMIFSPIAFASYTVPFTIPKFGKGEWWNQLFKLSFMAPIFTFFLYCSKSKR